uniref:Uncharacterized protein n=1 Tax=Pararge aegeria TaxID=116150 RepID=S4PAQ4_9NEOP
MHLNTLLNLRFLLNGGKRQTRCTYQHYALQYANRVHRIICGFESYFMGYSLGLLLRYAQQHTTDKSI